MLDHLPNQSAPTYRAVLADPDDSLPTLPSESTAEPALDSWGIIGPTLSLPGMRGGEGGTVSQLCTSGAMGLRLIETQAWEDPTTVPDSKGSYTFSSTKMRPPREWRGCSLLPVLRPSLLPAHDVWTALSARERGQPRQHCSLGMLSATESLGYRSSPAGVLIRGLQQTESVDRSPEGPCCCLDLDGTNEAIVSGINCGHSG